MPLSRQRRRYTSIVASSDFTLAAALGVQAAFPAPQDTITLETNTTYRFRGQYYISTGATTHTTAMAFASGGSLAIQDIKYQVNLFNTLFNATGTAQASVGINTNASTVLNATSSVASTIISFEGVIVITTGGTLIPQINFSANPTGTNLMLKQSYIEFEVIGSATTAIIGPFA